MADSFALPVVTRRPRAVRSGRPSNSGDAEVSQRDLEFLEPPSPAVISLSDFDGRFPPQLGQLGIAVPAPKRHQSDVELARDLRVRHQFVGHVGMSIPEQLARREERLAKLAEARAKPEARAKERFEREMMTTAGSRRATRST